MSDPTRNRATSDEQANGPWTVQTTWAPLTGQRDGDVTSQAHDDLADAVTAGRHLSCCEGARLIEVTGPDGTVAASWSRADASRWHDRTIPGSDRTRT